MLRPVERETRSGLDAACRRALPAPDCGVIFFAGGEDKLESLQRKEFIGLSSAVGLEFSKREPGVSFNSSGIFLLPRDWWGM
jgi:hypothetical protein